MFQIQASKLALKRSRDASTKSFPQQMITDHAKTTEECWPARHARSVNPEARLGRNQSVRCTFYGRKQPD